MNCSHEKTIVIHGDLVTGIKDLWCKVCGAIKLDNNWRAPAEAYSGHWRSEVDLVGRCNWCQTAALLRRNILITTCVRCGQQLRRSDAIWKKLA